MAWNTCVLKRYNSTDPRADVEWLYSFKLILLKKRSSLVIIRKLRDILFPV